MLFLPFTSAHFKYNVQLLYVNKLQLVKRVKTLAKFSNSIYISFKVNRCEQLCQIMGMHGFHNNNEL